MSLEFACPFIQAKGDEIPSVLGYLHTLLYGYPAAGVLAGFSQGTRDRRVEIIFDKRAVDNPRILSLEEFRGRQGFVDDHIKGEEV